MKIAIRRDEATQQLDAPPVPPHVTTVERDALTAVAGMQVYNTDNTQLEAYQSSAWGPLGGGGGGAPAGVDRDVQLNFGATLAALTGEHRFRVSHPFAGAIAHGRAHGAATELTPLSDYGVPGGNGAQISGRVFTNVLTSDYAHFSAPADGSRASGLIQALETVGAGTTKIEAASQGAVARGSVTVPDTAGSSFAAYLRASGRGSIAQGYVQDRYGRLYSTSDGSIASGTVRGQNSYLEAQAAGALAVGFAGNFGLSQSGAIRSTSSANGGIAAGWAEYGSIIANGNGALAQGRTDSSSSSYIEATGNGAMARGESNGYIMRANGVGAFASGHAQGGNIYAQGAASLVHGRTDNGYYQRANGVGALLGGFAENGNMQSNGIGSLVHGRARGNMEATGDGAVVLGAAYGGGAMKATAAGALAGGYQNGSNTRAYGRGSIAWGDAYGGGIYATYNGASAMGRTNGQSLRARAIGTTARGYAQGGGIYAGGAAGVGKGAVAMGHAYGNRIEASADGAFAVGRAGGGGIYASGIGAVAMGDATGYRITASGRGSVAMGSAYSAYIEATGIGSWAAGAAYSGNVRATARGAGQFSYGTNNEPDSFAVGPSLRLNSYGGTPSTLRNGDIWTQGGTVYIRSNGITQAI